MDVAARAETWLRVSAGKLTGPPAPASDEVDRHGFLVLSSVAHALAVLRVLDAPTIDAVFADLALAAGIRGRRVSPNVFRTGEGQGWTAHGPLRPAAPLAQGQLPSRQPVAGASAGWPPETLAAGGCLEVGEALIQILWLTRTPSGTFVPVRVRLPAGGAARPAAAPAPAGGGSPAVPLGPGMPGVEVIDAAGGVHALTWLAAQGDGRTSWGTAYLSPDLPVGTTSLRYRTAGVGDPVEVVVDVAPASPLAAGRCQDDGRSPAERYLDRLATRGGPSGGTSVEEVAASVWPETYLALRELGLVERSYVAEVREEAGQPEDAPAAVRLAPVVGAPAEARAAGVVIPLQHAGTYLEGYTVEEDRVVVHTRVRPSAGARPAEALWWHAVDPSGSVRPVEAIAGWHGAGGDATGLAIRRVEGEELTSLRLVASTPFESAFVELELT